MDSGIITKTDGRAEPHQATINITSARNLGKIFTNTAVRGIEKTAGNLSASSLKTVHKHLL